jgi:ADP-heptose:LPS heptosyltransferase
MGPTIPFLWWPYGKDHIVLRKDVDCSPCKHGICKTHECMELITTEDFIEAVERQIRVLDIFPSSKSSFRV